jgi:hypothetical protein
MPHRALRCSIAAVWVTACAFPDYGFEQPALPENCADGLRNYGEVAIDCGGACDPCPVCDDGALNGDETGIDCGGSCGPCPACDDGLRNGSETDVDCGGTCSRCGENEQCRERTDCASLVCSQGVCLPGNCLDGVRNGTESDVDCGGTCPACLNGNACHESSDCSSARCEESVCVSPGCTDGILNGEEADLDCGGAYCAPCAAGAGCEVAQDCASLVCADSGHCNEASCADAVQNQSESDIDCGGVCTACTSGQHCTTGGDCETALCQSGTCVPVEPSGRPLSKIGWAFSSSATAEVAPSAAIDGSVSTYWSSGENQALGMYVEIDMQEPRIFFKVLLQSSESPIQSHYAQLLDIYVSNDGTFNEPALSGVYGADWTWFEFPNAQVGRYLRIVLVEPRESPWSIGEVSVFD